MSILPASIDSIASNAYFPLMSTTLTIRNLDEGVKHKLRLQAALHQRSMEAEAREILTRGVEASSSEAALSPQERMRQGIEAVRGMWAGGLTTDQLMEITRGDDSDDAYSGR